MMDADTWEDVAWCLLAWAFAFAAVLAVLHLE